MNPLATPSFDPIGIASLIAATLLFVAMVIVGLRVVRGPHAADRVVAIDMLGLLGVAACGLAALTSDAPAFIDVALGIALVGFLTTAAFAAYIERVTARAGARS